MMHRRPENPEGPTLCVAEVRLPWAQQDASKEHRVLSTHGTFGGWKLTSLFTPVTYMTDTELLRRQMITFLKDSPRGGVEHTGF